MIFLPPFILTGCSLARWWLYLGVALLMQIIALVVTPFLPLFAVERLGNSDNNKYQRIEPRLPLWLSWFDTPDNSLLGDTRFRQLNPETYWSKVRWLYRNRLYGFKWTVLSTAVQQERTVVGNVDIGYQGQRFGSFTIKQPNGAWQYKIVKPLFGRTYEGNFGWLLDDVSKQRALFMFSIRLKKG